MTLPGEDAARRAARWGARWDVSPNLVSLLALLAAVAAAAAFARGRPLLAAPLVALAGYLDLVDGEVARRFDRSTRRGDFLDHTFDRLADVALFLGIGLGPAVPLELGLGAAVANLLVAYLGTQARSVGLDRVYGGLARRSNVTAILFLAALSTPLLPDALRYAAMLVIALSGVTFLQRFVAIYRRLP